MSKYKQIIIPETSTEGFIGTNVKELRRKVFDYYREKLQGKSVKNNDLGIEIQFVRDGARKLAYGGHIYIKKAGVIKILQKIIMYAKYNNWGDRKENDKPCVVGYLNFKVKAKVDGRMEYFHLVIQLRKNGKVYYTHEANIW